MPQLQIAGHAHSAPVYVGEVLDGELLDPRADVAQVALVGEVLDRPCSDCGQQHDICCHCGHIHDQYAGCSGSGPCGDYRCCVS